MIGIGRACSGLPGMNEDDQSAELTPAIHPAPPTTQLGTTMMELARFAPTDGNDARAYYETARCLVHGPISRHRQRASAGELIAVVGVVIAVLATVAAVAVLG